ILYIVKNEMEAKQMNKKQQFAVKINAPEIEAKIRHPRILDAFDKLEAGEFMELSNDHDPKPLHYQFMMEREGTFSWEYLQEGPQEWEGCYPKKVKNKRDPADRLVSLLINEIRNNI